MFEIEIESGWVFECTREVMEYGIREGKWCEKKREHGGFLGLESLTHCTALQRLSNLTLS